MEHFRVEFVILIVCLACSVVNCIETPLILTPYLKEGRIEEAQEKARVLPDIGGVRSYTGFFTVNEECGSYLFFWFVPAQINWKTAPVLLWLSGGPGCSSVVGMLTEIGPFNYNNDQGFLRRKYHWTKDKNVIFLDQPVGTGFSFSKKRCYAKSMTSATKEAYSALIQFFTLFPDLLKNRFFIVGESFGGYSIPALACEIDRRNNNASVKVNLIGVVVGNPYIDVRCHHNGPYFFELGIVDEKTRDKIIRFEESVVELINNKNYTGAMESRNLLYGEVLNNVGISDFYNIYRDKAPSFAFNDLFRKKEIRTQIHVGNKTFKWLEDEVYNLLEIEMYIPATYYTEYLLNTNKYIVGFYSGQLDTVCMYTSLPCVLRQLQWDGAADYLVANRSKWYVDGRLAGWLKTAGNLFEVVVRDSGHFVPTDQPKAAFELITAAIASNPGTRLLSTLETKPSPQ